jgi:hypothetical protein
LPYTHPTRTDKNHFIINMPNGTTVVNNIMEALGKIMKIFKKKRPEMVENEIFWED